MVEHCCMMMDLVAADLERVTWWRFSGL